MMTPEELNGPSVSVLLGEEAEDPFGPDVICLPTVENMSRTLSNEESTK